ncbi:M23 family metallopeptidase [Nocardiopsis halotolerans]|uniref:M23 family metallopeptidase n=1 Tax=Nocardiopsis halotolerans TaxID=124252 RepID=UPI000346A8C3|nr:M23 family metallopeptidase [Nocardiopsis halotolerans]
MPSFRPLPPLALALLLLLLPHPARAAADPGWRWPVAPPAGVLRPFDPPALRWLPGHLGVDLAAEPGQEVYAAGSGRVHFAGTVAGTPLVSVGHGDLRTTYLPVETGLARGDPVTAGDLLGTLAAEPVHCRSRPCLHWGLLRGADHLDPLSLLGLGEFRLLPLARSPTPPPHGARTHPGLGRPRTREGSVERPPEETREGCTRVADPTRQAAGRGRARRTHTCGAAQARGWARR